MSHGIDLNVDKRIFWFFEQYTYSGHLISLYYTQGLKICCNFENGESRALHMTGMIKTGNAGHTKMSLCLECEKPDIIRGAHAIFRNEIDKEIAVALI